MFDVFYIGTKPNAAAHEREVQSLEEAQALSRTRFYWIVNYLCDYSSWDFLWEPKPWESHQRHAFASQWQKDSETYLCPQLGYNETNYHNELVVTRLPDTEPWDIPEGIEDFDYSWHPDPTEPPYNYQFGTQWQKTGGPQYRQIGATATKYVSQVRVKNIAISKEVYLIDHGNAKTNLVKQQLESKGLTVKKVARFISSYQGTLQRILAQEENNYVWVCSSVCDYSNFDFSWHPELWQGTMLHVFSSNNEKFGDTFLVNTPTFNERIKTTEILEWYDTIHFVDNIDVPRWPTPVVNYDSDTLVDTVWNHTFNDPAVLFTKGAIPAEMPTINYWREKTRTITPLSLDNSAAVIPREAKNHLKTQIYDYPFILKTNRRTLDAVHQDIVYISYDEIEAEENFKKLKDLHPTAKRVHGVKGMEQALVAAAEASDTPWYYAVFAKTAIEPSFKFDFVPDYFQQPKHYIFNCRNRVNGLEYGHMGMVMYNCEMVKNGPGYYTDKMGLDYTISFPTESIPLLSCHGNFDTSPYQTWRTTFREVAKLSLFNSQKPDLETEYRLKVWTTKAEGPYAEWALKGAADGVEFFEETGGDLEKMKASFDWEWLRERFVSRHGEQD
jgi:hypothetical protein